jgi:hypothetical protein
MHSLKRAGMTVGLAAGLALASAPPALAGGWWGDVDCGKNPNPGCELGAGKSGELPASPGPKSSRQPNPHSPLAGENGPPPDPGDTIVGGDPHLAHCSYAPSSYQPPAPGAQTASVRRRNIGGGNIYLASLSNHLSENVVWAQAPGPGGAWYIYRCSGSGVRDGLYRAPVWIPDGAVPGAVAVPSPQDLAQQARSQLRLPGPTIVSNPAGIQLVTLPTWLWLDRSSWDPQSATAAVPGVSVTAVATPTSVSWSMGDGTDVTCTGPGTPFPAGGDPQATSPDCGHTYRRSSAGAPGQAFGVSATEHWTVTWSGAGTGGTFPDLTTAASASFRVAEAQALGTGPH